MKTDIPGAKSFKWKEGWGIKEKGPYLHKHCYLCVVKLLIKKEQLTTSGFYFFENEISSRFYG